MVDIGGWASKLVFLHSSSLTNLCLRGLILTMSILASVMFGTVHSMLYIFLPQPNLRQLRTFLIFVFPSVPSILMLEMVIM